MYFMTSSSNELHDTGLICQDAIKTLKVLGPCSMFIFKFSVYQKCNFPWTWF